MSDPLLVPMHLEAMVLSNAAQAAEGFLLAQAQYRQPRDVRSRRAAPL